MTDNVTTVANVFATVPVGTTIATDNIAGVQYQLVKIGFGLNDSWTYTSTTNPLPVTLANTGANSTALKVDGSAVTQPVSQPTAANLNATVVGTGTFAVQASQSGSWIVTANAGTNLNTSALALESGGNLATVAGAVIAQEATTLGVKGVTAFGAVTTAAPTYTTAKSDALSLDTSGLLRVSLKDTPANTNKFLVTPDALPPHQSVNVDQLNGTIIDTNSGVKSAGTLRVVLATDQPQLTNTLLVSQTPVTTGGATIFRLLSANTTNSNNIKAGAGQIYGFVITNTNASARFVKLYNKATAPTVGTDTPAMTLVIPGNASGAGMVAAEFSSGIAFGTGIGIGITAVVTDADTTAVATNEVVVNLFYK